MNVCSRWTGNRGVIRRRERKKTRRRFEVKERSMEKSEEAVSVKRRAARDVTSEGKNCLFSTLNLQTAAKKYIRKKSEKKIFKSLTQR